MMRLPFATLTVTFSLTLFYGCTLSGKAWVKEPDEINDASSCNDAKEPKENEDEKSEEDKRCEPRLVGSNP